MEVLLWGLNNVHLILGVSITVLHSLNMMFYVLICFSTPYSPVFLFLPLSVSHINAAE